RRSFSRDAPAERVGPALRWRVAAKPRRALMSADPSFADLMSRLRNGDDAAATEVFRHFAQRLIQLARSRLDRLVRQKIDPEDVLQSVYRSFFRRHAQGHYVLESWDSLWGMLTVITVRKCGLRAKHFRAACRDVQRGVPLPAGPDAGGLEFEALAREPTPLEAAQLADVVEQLMRELEGRERDVLALSLQGSPTAEISTEVARSERTVQRVLKRIKRRLEE